MKYLKVLCFTTALSLSISFVSAQSLDAVIASNEISHSDEQIEPHLAGEDTSGNLGSMSGMSGEDNRGSEVNMSSGLEDSRGSLAGVSGMESGGTDGQMVGEDNKGIVSSSSTDGQLVTEIQPQEDKEVVSSGMESGGLSGSNSSTTGQNQVPMSAEEFSSLLSSSSVTPDTTSRLSTTVTSLIKKAASTITTLLCVFITAFLSVRVLLDLMFLALPFTESIATKFGLGGSETPTYNLSSSLPGGNSMSLPPNPSMNPRLQTPQSPSYPSSPSYPTSSSRKFTLVSEEVLRARQSPHPIKTYCHDAVIILTVTPMLLVLTVSGVFNHLGLLFGDVIIRLLNNLGGIL